METQTYLSWMWVASYTRRRNVCCSSLASLSRIYSWHVCIQAFPWCGYLIDTEDLSVMADYSRFHDNCTSRNAILCIGYILSSRSHRFFDCWAWAPTKFCIRSEDYPVWRYFCSSCNDDLITSLPSRTAMAKSHPIYNDLALNSSQTVYKNIHQAFMLAAMKMHAYIKATGKGGTSGLAFVLQECQPSSSLEAEKQGRRDGKVSSLRKQHLVRKGGNFLMSESLYIINPRTKPIRPFRHNQAVNSIYLYIDQE